MNSGPDVTSISGGYVCVASPGGGCSFGRTRIAPLFAFVPILGGNLPTGTWQLVGADPTGLFVTARSQEFTVVSCKVLHDDDCPVVFQPSPDFKTAKRNLEALVDTTCKLMSVLSLLLKARQTFGISMAMMVLRAEYPGHCSPSRLLARSHTQPSI